jgi:hypothetical protein
MAPFQAQRPADMEPQGHLNPVDGADTPIGKRISRQVSSTESPCVLTPDVCREFSYEQEALDSRILKSSKSERDCDFERQSTFLKVPGVVVVEVEDCI